MLKLKEVADIFQFKNYSGVSSTIGRINNLIICDPNLKTTMDQIVRKLVKSQKQT
jgi:hypothetical protein